MPHLRQRHLTTIFNKSLKFWPVICLVGSRQVGKSTFLRSLPKYKYLSFDDNVLVSLAALNPKQILSSPCVIDEAQKVPKIFDAVKLDVDEEKRPGKYILAGSVRFSSRTLTRESLTGRAKTLQMFPLTCSETLALNFQDRWRPDITNARVARKEFLRYLSRGGMPAIFSARNHSETSSYWNALIESYVYRDLLMAVPKSPRPALALSVLKAVAEILALGELPTLVRISKKVGGTRSMLDRHIYGLEDMMILHRISCLGGARTKDILMPFDPAFFLTLLRMDSPLHDAAIYTACIYIALINEALSQAQNSGGSLSLQYAVSAKNEMIHLITRDHQNRPIFWKIIQEPVAHHYQTRFLTALAKKNNGIPRLLTSSDKIINKDEAVPMIPWECVL